MSEMDLPEKGRKVIAATIKALKAARILRGLSRAMAAERCNCSARAIEQLENGRCNPSETRVMRIVRAYGLSKSEFESLRAKPDEALLKSKAAFMNARAISRKPRRSCFRIICKEVRVLRILRQRKGLSQDDASLRCGYTRAIFGQIENGRINIPPERIMHIVLSLGYTMADFETLMMAEVLRDEVVAECSGLLQKLDDQKLISMKTIIKSLGGI